MCGWYFPLENVMYSNLSLKQRLFFVFFRSVLLSHYKHFEKLDWMDFLKVLSSGAKLWNSRKLKLKKHLFVLLNNIRTTTCTNANSNHMLWEFKKFEYPLNWERGFPTRGRVPAWCALVCDTLANPAINIGMFIVTVLLPTAGSQL